MTEDKHVFEKFDIDLSDDKLDEFAQKYIELRSKIAEIPDFKNDPRLKNLGFSTDKLIELIQKSTIPIRHSTDPVRDIYRSDLGEMLLTFFFDEEYKDFGESFVIPIKNIWDREHNDYPGRGIDVTGYKSLENKIEILIGEAKVSGETKNPPQSSGEIYKEQVKYVSDKEYFKRRLSNYSKKLTAEHAKNFMLVLLAIENDLDDIYEVVYGCCLIRDTTCFDVGDYGKMQSEKTEFNPNKIHFVVPVFNRPISDAVDLFYKKVQERING